MKQNFTKQDFYAMLTPNGDCLEWTGYLTEKGYGRTLYKGTLWRTHRIALDLEGIDVTGIVVMHSCDNPACCNPAHLSIGTQKQNVDDMINKGRATRNVGSKHHRSKLVESQVIEIKHRLSIGEEYSTIASDYGVDRTCIGLIKRGKTWSHV